MDSVNYNISRNADGTMRVSTATRVGGTRRPRLSDGKSHPCLITRADGSQTVIVKSRNSRDRRKKTTTYVDIPHRTTAADLPAIFAD